MKKRGNFERSRYFFTFLKRAIPKTLFACTCMETNHVEVLPIRSVSRRPTLDTIHLPGK